MFLSAWRTVRLQLTANTQHVRLSLRTAEPVEVKRRLSTVDCYLDVVWTALRSDKPLPLSQLQATALAGDAYRAWAKPEGRERTTAIELSADGKWNAADVSISEDVAQWDAAAVSIARTLSESDADDVQPIVEETFGPIVDRLLLAKGIQSVDRRSRDTVLIATAKALRAAFERRRDNASGDYSPDPNAQRFPQWQPLAGTGHSVQLTTLLDEWWAEARAAGRGISTYESYSSAVRKLIAHLGHEDAERIEAADIIAFKDARLAAGVSPKTVKDSDLTGLKSIFKRARQNGRLSSNPTANVTVLRATPVRLRSKSFTTAEAASILRHANAHRRSRSEAAKTADAKRWLPWLCAYTGARLGEVAQLRKRDVRMEGGLAIMTITPEAGTVKDKQLREVVLHEHLIELGFLAFVEAAHPGHLFLTGREGDDLRGAWRTVKNRVREFAREVVADKNVAPNHAWRHLFKTIGRQHGIEDRVLDAIEGHSPASVGGGYGDVTLEAQALAMRKFPRFDVAD